MEPKGLAVWTWRSSDNSPGWSSSTRFSMRRMFFQVGSPERGHLQSPPGLCAWAQWAGGATVLGHDQPGDSSQARDSALGTPLKEGWQCVGKHPASRPPGQLNLIPHTSTDDLHGTEPTGPHSQIQPFLAFSLPPLSPPHCSSWGHHPRKPRGCGGAVRDGVERTVQRCSGRDVKDLGGQDARRRERRERPS
jgi:hypothetical protein